LYPGFVAGEENMASVAMEPTKRSITSAAEVERFLGTHGVFHAHWPVPPSVKELQDKPLLSQEEQERVLAAYRPHLEQERTERGYVQADMVILSPQTPSLDDILAKFDKLHYHADDEVRYIFAGEGIFGFEGKDGTQFTITVSAGDYIIIPARSYHWFTLTSARTIKAIRLFKDTKGWVPHYKNAIG
jgi:1,2-dihydroxy-3-keto-5-methylthiopentene dioxygenase